MKTIDTIEANAYLMRGALPSVERSRDEYTGSVFGSAALAYITIIHATDALDMMQERLPELYDDRQIRKYINRMTGTKASMGEIRKLTLAIGELLAHRLRQGVGGRLWQCSLRKSAALYREVTHRLGKCFRTIRRSGYKCMRCHSCSSVACKRGCGVCQETFC